MTKNLNYIRKIIADGQKGLNLGFKIKTFPKFNKLIGGLKKKAYIVVSAEEKAGKSTFVNNAFILGVIQDLDVPNIKYIYFSLEMSVQELMAEFIAWYIHRDYNININISTIIGEDYDENGNQIFLTDKEKELIDIIIDKYINKIFGEYDENGKKITEGIIDVYDKTINPTGIQKIVWNISEKFGTIHKRIIPTGQEIVSHYENTSGKHLVVILDHCRRLDSEEGLKDKALIDRMSKYFVNMKNLFGWTFINVVHANRSSVDNETIKRMGQEFHITQNMTKDSGNFGEDCTTMITITDIWDVKYGLISPFGLRRGTEINRVISIVLNRSGGKKINNFFTFKNKIFTEC